MDRSAEAVGRKTEGVRPAVKLTDVQSEEIPGKVEELD